MLLTDFTTRGLPGSFWQTRRGSSALQLPLALPCSSRAAAAHQGTPPHLPEACGRSRGSSYSSKEVRRTPAVLAEPGLDGGLTLMTMFWSGLELHLPLQDVLLWS